MHQLKRGSGKQKLLKSRGSTPLYEQRGVGLHSQQHYLLMESTWTSDTRHKLNHTFSTEVKVVVQDEHCTAIGNLLNMTLQNQRSGL